jgi:CDP-diacylglycerol--glycerol-3-phosphate 3-phosphatidyltransferase
MLRDIPNLLTASRIVVIPFILLAMYFDASPISHKIAASLFLYACITDFLDGFIARAYSSQSYFGRCLDPIADKVLIGAVVVMLVKQDKAPLLPAIAIISREILVSGLREFLAQLKVSVPVSRLSQLKTALQMIAICILMLGDQGTGLTFLDKAGGLLLWCAAGLTLFTGYAYFKASYRYFSHSFR